MHRVDSGILCPLFCCTGPQSTHNHARLVSKLTYNSWIRHLLTWFAHLFWPTFKHHGTTAFCIWMLEGIISVGFVHTSVFTSIPTSTRYTRNQNISTVTAHYCWIWLGLYYMNHSHSESEMHTQTCLTICCSPIAGWVWSSQRLFLSWRLRRAGFYRWSIQVQSNGGNQNPV